MPRFQNERAAPHASQHAEPRQDLVTGVDETGRYRNPQPDWIKRGVLLILGMMMAFGVLIAFWWFATGGLTPEQ
jgi:hypothetical protein